MSSNDSTSTDAAAGPGLSEGLGPVGWRYVPSEVWGEQVLTQDPKTAQLARDMGRHVEPLYTEAQMLARVAAERERCAQRLEAMAARSPDGDTDRYALLAAADELRRA